MVEQNNKIQSLKRQSIVQTIIVLAIIIVVNILSQQYFKRIDLTSDKRYSLGDVTKEVLEGLDDKIYIKVYLAGDLPASFRNLKESTLEMLDEMRIYSDEKIEYEFVDPLLDATPKEQEEIIRQLARQGLEPVNLEVREDDQQVQQLIFPGAILSYRNKYIPIMLLKQQIGVHPEQQLHNSIVGLEYEIINSIKKLIVNDKKKIAFLTGHGELAEKYTTDLENTLSQQYEYQRIELEKYKVGILDKFDLLLIAKPDSTFSKLDKYRIDQFITKGGKVLWMVEPLLAELDSLGKSGVASTIDYPLNINDLLFHYGIRLQPNLIQDYQCHFIPIMATYGSQQQEFGQWPYFPVIFSRSTNPIVNNLNATLFRFASSIDTVATPNAKKEILLQSSEKSKVSPHIARISLQQVLDPLDPNQFMSGPQNLAVLVEGRFNSFYDGYAPVKTGGMDYGKFVKEGKPTKMIFISDGDIAVNQYNNIRQQSYPLGYDRFTNQTFGNKTFIMNCIDYLLDDSGIIQLRSKQFKLRLLDKAKIKESKLKWQVINMLLPLVFIILFGIIYSFYRKNRFVK